MSALQPFRTIRTASGACDLFLGRGLLARLGSIEAIRAASGVGVVFDRTTARLFGAPIERALGPPAARFAFPAGERNKTLATAERAIDAMARGGADRRAIVIACGGGVVTDLGGFVASIYHRGIDWVAVPTTLLGMVDAAVGGKTGVDLVLGKNLAGTFHPPRAVVADLDVLATLPQRERAAGLAEVVKIALAADAKLFEEIEARGSELLRQGTRAEERVIRRAIAIKADHVERDERDVGARLALNLGHTTAHALEAATGYARFRHGEAVAIGLRVACEVAAARGVLDPSVSLRVARVLASLDLPYAWPRNLPIARTLAHAKHDKKVERGELRFVLPRAVGRVDVSTATLGELADAAKRTTAS